ncbi:HEPN domain-containing protein [Vibrio vulnificus]|nr:HEPN domain-containing protein [Vibrio vulnificus]
MSLVLLWGALEAIFTKDKAELRFRVSVMIASYLEPDGGDKAYQLYKKVAKLYNERSKAAHGDNSVKQDTLLQTYELLYKAVEKMFEQNSVPTKESLERSLLG